VSVGLPRPAPPALADIQAPVRESLTAVVAELRGSVTADFPLLEAVTDHLMLMQGKMFRPTMVLLASSLEGPVPPRATALAAIVELVHLATLVHDDAVDHSVLRRGMPTVNSVFSHQVSVIAGDFLYSRAMVELVRDGDLSVLDVMANTTNAMTVGEMRQLAALDALAFTEADYEALIRSKTASLLSAACEIGAIAGAPRFREQLARYGERLGMGFQVADDLLDYTAEESVTGKPSGLDLREHKVTLPLIAALASVTPAERAEIDALFATSQPTERQIGRVVEIVTARGGLEYAHNRAQQYAEDAERALHGLPAGPALTALHEAISYAVDRSR
jgi:octaprenyl-diphosphate synthase